MQQLYSENKQQKIIMTVNNNNSRGSSVPNFEYVSYDRVQDLYEQNKGTLYFIPEGFEPVLVPNDSKAQAVTNLLENAKPVSAAPNVPRMLPDTDVRLPSFALPVGVAGPAPKKRKRRVQPREDSPQGDLHLHLPPQNFSAQNLSMLDASSFYPPATTARRISSTISSLDENSNEFNNNRNLNYYDNTSNYDIDSPVSSTNTSIVNDQSGGMINLNAYDISQNGTGDYINYLELAAATDYQLYDGYDHFTTYIPPAADQFSRNQFVKFDC
ncbi:8873_t:CDS:2 [Entrophospora sp. SA101]|nr:8873_t:CDS:2 [Entrophospora sp. SA101]